jgi:PBSX family phage terminase large subunit
MVWELPNKESPHGEFIKRSSKRLNFAVGSVRSGKTVCSLIRWFIYLTSDAPENGEFLMCAKTAGTLKRNILLPFQEFCPSFEFSSGKQEARLGNRIIHLVGANDEKSEGKIRGATLAGAYADEITLFPQSFFMMLLSRLSVPNAKLFGTTNPDSPTHWLKQDYLDRHDLDLYQQHFSIEENPHLTSEYKNSLKMEYTGHWLKRYYYGQWVAASGAIYDMINDSHFTDELPSDYGYKVCAIDYGTNNPFCALLIHCELDGTYFVEKEYYFNSKKMGRQKTDSEYADDVLSLFDPRFFIIDPSASSFKLEIKRRGAKVIDANNDVLNGIQYLSGLFAANKIKINKSCIELERELYSYHWDESARNQSIERPIKKDDHACDALRYGIFTIKGRAINGEILTEPTRDSVRVWG